MPYTPPSDLKHEAWLKKFNKTRAGKLYNLMWDIEMMNSNPNKRSHYNKLSYMAAALVISTKGTKMEEDAKKIITLVYPEYYNEDQETTDN